MLRVSKSEIVKDKRGKFSSDFQFLGRVLDSVGDEAAAEISAGLWSEQTITDTAGNGPGGETACAAGDFKVNLSSSFKDKERGCVS